MYICIYIYICMYFALLPANFYSLPAKSQSLPPPPPPLNKNFQVIILEKTSFLAVATPVPFLF